MLKYSNQLLHANSTWWCPIARVLGCFDCHVATCWKPTRNYVWCRCKSLSFSLSWFLHFINVYPVVARCHLLVPESWMIRGSFHLSKVVDINSQIILSRNAVVDYPSYKWVATPVASHFWIGGSSKISKLQELNLLASDEPQANLIDATNEWLRSWASSKIHTWKWLL